MCVLSRPDRQDRTALLQAVEIYRPEYGKEQAEQRQFNDAVRQIAHWLPVSRECKQWRRDTGNKARADA